MIFISIGLAAGRSPTGRILIGNNGNPIEINLLDAEPAAEIPKDLFPQATPASVIVESSTVLASNESSHGRVSLLLTGTPEYTTIGMEQDHSFHAIASITIKDDVSIYASRKAMDIVCVLDNSGSMSGGKFTYLKHAMRFVQSQLQPQDRLSIITFNSHAVGVHGLLRMNGANKAISETKLNSLTAGGGTDIYSGMRMGYDILNRRTTKNTINCMFLLTDGIDNSMLTEKKALAASMKAEGTGLYIFAFGADHDSNHLREIATAGESSYIYIEHTDQVIDAFGGALGSQQGLAAKNIELQLDTVSSGVVIDEVNAGEYKVQIAAGSQSAKITFATLFVGEKRDVLVRLRVPAVTAVETIPQYPLFESSASYVPIGVDGSPRFNSTVEENYWCSISRTVGHVNNPLDRHVEVDAQVYRLKVTELLKRAMDMGDANNVVNAKKLLLEMKVEMDNSSVALRGRHATALQVYEDLKTAIASMETEEEFVIHGGKARVTEAFISNGQQRTSYNKRSSNNEYQTLSSSKMQINSAGFLLTAGVP